MKYFKSPKYTDLFYIQILNLAFWVDFLKYSGCNLGN